MEHKNNDPNVSGSNCTELSYFGDAQMWSPENLKSFYTDTNEQNMEDCSDQCQYLKTQLNGLRWDLSDAQMDVNRLSRMYLELCEMASPWMDQIQNRKKDLTVFTETDDEASMHRPALSEQPRVRNENAQDLKGNEVNWDHIYPAPSSAGSVAVHLHLYYVDLTEEFIQFFQNIPFPFDLYISCRDIADPGKICRDFSVLNMAQSIIVRKTQNRGRDIAPLYVLFRKEIASHDYFLHVHSKKSLFTGSEQVEWRVGAMRCLCGSEMQVRKIFAVLQCQRNVGLLFPETVDTMHFLAHSWLQNGHFIKKLSKEFGFQCAESYFNYPVGSFFWARTEAIRPILDRNYTYEDFDAEQGQIDGTLAHALERAVALTARGRNYSLAIVDANEGVLRFDHSVKALRSYFKENVASAKKTLSQYDAVSFDIFDTLITRKLYEPDDLFHLMGKAFKNKYGFAVDYLKYRKKAEQIAVSKHGDFTNIHHIYDELPDIMEIDTETAQWLKEKEINLELECCIPRRDMLEIYRYLRSKQIPIYLVSDMYLTEDIVDRMLKKCGYDGYDTMYLSCEMGLRKDSGSMWRFLRNIWQKERVIHVGDNPSSDAQRPADLKIYIYPVLNPRTLFQISALYKKTPIQMYHSAASEYTMGMLINGCLFNSPFALQDEDTLRPIHFETASKAMFGATLLSFVQSIARHTNTEQDLLFLAREGYFLQKLYNTYFDLSGRQKNPNHYFLASRRAVSVASAKDQTDIRRILSDYYSGSLGNLLRTRLGIEIPIGPAQLQVTVPDQLPAIMDLFRSNMEALLVHATNERDAYIQYASSILPGNNSATPVVIDLGYSGTIQYHLNLLLNRKIDGYYLYTGSNKKPLRLGCGCESLFSQEHDDCVKLFAPHTLYLESILQAPHGQVLHFNQDPSSECGVSPVYRNEEMPPNEIFVMQDAILDYAEDYARFEQAIGFHMDLEPELAICSFAALIESKLLPTDILKLFLVEDFFCGQGIKRVDPKTGKWIAGDRV